MEQLLILGAGGLGRVAAETAEAAGYEVFFLDAAARGAKAGGRCMDYADLKDRFPRAIAAFGNNRLRLRWVNQLLEAGFEVPAWCIRPRW